jgi:hypothetical protein
MASPLSASAFLSALRAEGLDVYGYKSWQTNNRNHKGSWGPVHGVMIHHTVTSSDDSSVSLCYNGHSQLPGPLCHGVGRNDGRIALVGYGRANHAGSGDDDVLRAVINETALPAVNEANTDGNRHFYGLEGVNLGNGVDTWPWKQYVAVVKFATAICRAHGWSERSVIGHKEWQPGKIDPKGPVVRKDGTVFQFDMDLFRTHVRLALALPAGAWATDREEEEIMALSPEDVKNIWRYAGATDPTRQAWAFVQDAYKARQEIADLKAKVEAQNAKLDAILAKLNG